MASHHGCHQHQTHHHLQSASCYSCCCATPSPQQPQLSPSDPLLQAIASQLLHQQNHLLFTQYPQPHHSHQPNHHRKPKEEEKPQSQALYTSLLRRITALEASLHHLSSSSSTPSSLRDHAARTIQTRFRAHLVRRSQTLRNLKHLATIKTAFHSLQSSKLHLNPDLLSRKALDLLHKLDSIQGSDPMIRDGKRSMRGELIRFLELLDGVLVKRQQLHSQARKNVKFAEEAKRSRVYKPTQNQFSGEESGGSSDDQAQVLESLRRKIENIEGFSRVYEDDEEESQIDSEAPSSGASDRGRNPRVHVKSKVNHGDSGRLEGQNANSMFCPPLPVQMESVTDAR